MKKYYIVSGIMAEGFCEKSENGEFANDPEIERVISDGFAEGITNAIIEADDADEAVRIATKFYGFDVEDEMTTVDEMMQED